MQVMHLLTRLYMSHKHSCVRVRFDLYRNGFENTSLDKIGLVEETDVNFVGIYLISFPKNNTFFGLIHFSVYLAKIKPDVTSSKLNKHSSKSGIPLV